MWAAEATRARLPDGRWHFQHGPIDLVIGCDGDPVQCDAAIAAAWATFRGLLAELVAELPALKRPVQESGPLRGPVARRMVQACLPLARDHGLFSTAMAAVAGSVADEIVAAFRRPGIARAHVNNGGDIALHLATGERYDVGLVANLELPALDGRFAIEAASPVRGIATSGWRGRSFSLGIADSVTVVAETAAQADAAATLVANHVDVTSAVVERRPASSLKDDSDLGDRLVTVAVGCLTPAQVQAAIDAGAAFAAKLLANGRIAAAAIVLAGQARVVRSR